MCGRCLAGGRCWTLAGRMEILKICVARFFFGGDKHRPPIFLRYGQLSHCGVYIYIYIYLIIYT